MENIFQCVRKVWTWLGLTGRNFRSNICSRLPSSAISYYRNNFPLVYRVFLWYYFPSFFLMIFTGCFFWYYLQCQSVHCSPCIFSGINYNVNMLQNKWNNFSLVHRVFFLIFFTGCFFWYSLPGVFCDIIYRVFFLVLFTGWFFWYYLPGVFSALFTRYFFWYYLTGVFLILFTGCFFLILFTISKCCRVNGIIFH